MADEVSQVGSDVSGGSSQESAPDQGAFINDAFAGWISGDDNKDAQPNQEAKKPIEKTVQPQKEAQAQPPKEGAAIATPDKQVEAKPSILSAFTKDGAFDFKGFSSFVAPKVENQPALNIEPQQQAQPQKEEIPIWKQRIDEAKKYEEDTKKVVLGWSQEIRALVQQGYSPEDAILKLEADYENLVNNHLNDWKAEREFKLREEDEKTASERVKEAEEMNRLQELTKVNQARIVASLPGNSDQEKTALFNEVLFSKDIGAPILNYEFKRAYPNSDQMTQEQLDKTAREFLQRITGDYNALSYYFERALDRAARMNIPTINEKVAAATEAATAANKLASQRAPKGTLGRSQQSGKQATAWDSYFNNPNEMADRIN